MNEDVLDAICDAVTDAVAKFLYYDRIDDSALPVGVIDKLVREHTLTVEEISEMFRDAIKDAFSE